VFEFNFDIDEILQPFQILAIKFNVIVTGALYPQRFDSPSTLLVNSEPVRKVNDFVFRAVNYKYWRRYALYLVYAAIRKH
jgi:hypothetical protein